MKMRVYDEFKMILQKQQHSSLYVLVIVCRITKKIVKRKLID